MREFFIEEKLHRIMNKLGKKDRNTYLILMKKIKEITACPDVNNYKNLRAPLQEFKRVHINGPLILVFKYRASDDSILFYDFDHHDSIYGR